MKNIKSEKGNVSIHMENENVSIYILLNYT